VPELLAEIGSPESDHDTVLFGAQNTDLQCICGWWRI